MVRFANTYGPNDWNGAQTAELVKTWPKQSPSDRVPKPAHMGEYGNYSTSGWNVGSKILSRADQSYTVPSGFNIAGQSKRITSFYRKTGVSEHRTEPGFRDTKGGATYTELNAGPVSNSPHSTFRTPFENTASLVLTRRAREMTGHPGAAMYQPSPGGPGSGRSRRSEPGSFKSAPNSMARLEQAAGMSTPKQKVDWDWDPLPMYHSCNQMYGSHYHDKTRPKQLTVDDPLNRSAGKSWSGFLTPTQIQRAMQNPGECLIPPPM